MHLLFLPSTFTVFILHIFRESESVMCNFSKQINATAAPWGVPDMPDEDAPRLPGESIPLIAPGAPQIKATVGDVEDVSVTKRSDGLGISLAGDDWALFPFGLQPLVIMWRRAGV